MVQVDLPGEGQAGGGTVVLEACGFGHLTQTLCRHSGMGQHDNGKGHRDNGAKDDVDILDHGEDIAGREAAAALHPDAAQPDDQQDREIQHKGRQGVDDGHVDVGADDVVGHDTGRLGDAPVGVALPVKGPDDPDAPEAFAHQVVLPVAVFVGDLPQVGDLLAHQQNHGNQQRNRAEDDQREPEILPHAQKDGPKEHQRDNHQIAAEHGDDPVQGPHVVGGAGDQVGGANPPHLRQSHGVDLAENGGAQAPGVAGDDVINHPVAARNGGDADQGDGQHQPGCF